MQLVEDLDECRNLRCPNGHEGIRSVNYFHSKSSIEDRKTKNLPMLKCFGYHVCHKGSGKIAVRPCARSQEEKSHPVYILKPGTSQPNFLIHRYETGKTINEKGNEMLRVNLM